MDHDAILAANRQATHFFIISDPSEITLTPHSREQAPSGGYENREGQPRGPQTLKVIYQSSKGTPDSTEDGAVAKQDVVIVGEYDAVIEQGDVFTWPSGSDTKWVVTGIHPYNGYEVKADVVAFGKHEVP